MNRLSFRELVRSQDLKIGTVIAEFATPAMGHLIKSAGCDFAVVDMEHNGWSFETVKTVVRFLHDAGVVSMVRPPSMDQKDIARALDVGAQGIQPPKLETAEQAMRIVNWIKYPPQGVRGVCCLGPQDDYVSRPVAERMHEANSKTSFVALIETATGVENVEQIMEVDGLDAVSIGPFDLSASMGIAGQFEHPKMRAAVDRVMAAAKSHHKSVCRPVGSSEEAAASIAAGYNLILYGVDLALYQSALASGVREVRTAWRGHALVGATDG